MIQIYRNLFNFNLSTSMVVVITKLRWISDDYDDDIELWKKDMNDAKENLEKIFSEKYFARPTMFVISQEIT